MQHTYTCTHVHVLYNRKKEKDTEANHNIVHGTVNVFLLRVRLDRDCLLSSIVCFHLLSVETFCDKATAPPPPVIMNWLRNVAAQSLNVLQSQPDTKWKVCLSVTRCEMLLRSR